MAKRNNTRSVGNWILFGFSSVPSLIGWFLGALSMAAFMTHRPRFEGAGILTLKWRDWVSKRARLDEDGTPDEGWNIYSTSLFGVIYYHEDRPEARSMAEETDTAHEQHETIHTRQFRDASVSGFFMGLSLASTLWAFGWYAEAWQPAVLWLLSWPLVYVWTLTNVLTPLLRYGPATKEVATGTKRSWFRRLYDVGYKDSEHERSARAQTVPVNKPGEPLQTWADREYARRH